MYPLLVILAGFCSLFGGFLVGSIANIVTPEDFIYGLRYSFDSYAITFALIKSLVFAFLISSISSFRGYYTQGGALEVGIATTAAVTASIIAVLISDYLLAQLLYVR